MYEEAKRMGAAQLKEALGTEWTRLVNVVRKEGVSSPEKLLSDALGEVADFGPIFREIFEVESFGDLLRLPSADLANKLKGYVEGFAANETTEVKKVTGR